MAKNGILHFQGVFLTGLISFALLQLQLGSPQELIQALDGNDSFNGATNNAGQPQYWPGEALEENQ